MERVTMRNLTERVIFAGNYLGKAYAKTTPELWR